MGLCPSRGPVKSSAETVAFRVPSQKGRRSFSLVSLALANEDRYKRIALDTPHLEEAKLLAIRQEIIIETKLEGQLPIFDNFR